MTKIISIALIMALMLLLVACSNSGTSKPQAPQEKPNPSSLSKPKNEVTADFIAERANVFFSEAETLGAKYTNKNGHVYFKDVLVPSAKFSEVEILSKKQEGEYIHYTCKAKIENADWVGSAEFVVALISPDSGEISYTINAATVEPSYPLDFSDEDIAVLLESKAFRYKPSPSEHMTTTILNKETVQSMKMLEFLPETEPKPSEYETYKIEIHFVDGLVLQGTAFADYLPRMWEVEVKYEGIERWSCLVHDDFIQVK